MARIRRRLLLTGSVFVVLFCASGLIRYGLEARRSARIERDFQEIYYGEDPAQEDQNPLQGAVLRQFEVSFPRVAADAAEPTAAPASASWPGGPDLTVLPALRRLRQQNPDIMGWLSIPEVLDQAVVQRDNTYYLKKDYLGHTNANGALFLEEGISLRTRPDAYIIFGHNMKTGGMFGSLRLYEDVGYFRRHALISFDAMYEEGEYVVFSVADVGTQPGNRHYLPFMQLPGADAALRTDCIQKLQRYSIVLSPVNVRADDQLLLLVTCDGTDNTRRIVAARRLREGEKAEALQTQLQRARKK